MNLVRLTWSNIAGSRFRSWVVFFCAIILAGFAISATLVIGGARKSLQLALERLGADIIVVPTGSEERVQDALLMGRPVRVWMPRSNLDVIGSIPGVSAVSPQLYLATLRGATCCSVPEMFLIAYEPVWAIGTGRTATPAQALKHPNWDMGAKITVDSATLMNKGLEFIEAMHLYGASPDQIKILIHPQSIIHSMVEFIDNSVIAQMSVPDMRLPIQYALTYPERQPSLTDALDLTGIGTLSFEEPDMSAFRCLKLALITAGIRGTACAVMNAANEAAVSLFLEEKITLNQIYECAAYALDRIKNIENPSPDDILAADKDARQIVLEHFRP